MAYTPDIWVFVEIHNPQNNKTVYKVLAGWYGGFTQGNEWRLNSGIEEIIEHDSYYEVLGASGSVYYCHKQGEKTGEPTFYVLSDLLNNKQGFEVNVVQYSEIQPSLVKKRKYDGNEGKHKD